MVSKKVRLEFQRYPPNKICTAPAVSTNLRKKSINFSKNPERNIPRPMLGQDRPVKNSDKCLFEAASSESSTDIDRQNQRLRHEMNGDGSLGAPPTAGDMWRAPARRLIQKYLAAGA